MLVNRHPQDILDTALHALSTGPECRSLLDELPAPIYTTDADGAVTYWNRACVDFAGREPQRGQDRWCVTWKIYTTAGEFLPHDQCPMAKAVQEQRPIREVVAIAERPDGSRVAFKPYPTPLFDKDGTLTGAVNMLIDVTEEQCSALQDQAARCRRLAGATYDCRRSSARHI
jgi:PAS domain S-box-containing protein